jgi:hypothetical protein
MGADEMQIEVSFREAIRTAKEQKSISRVKRAEATYAEYRGQKASGSGALVLYSALMGQWRYSQMTDKQSAAMQIAERVHSLAQEQNDSTLTYSGWSASSV